MPTATFNVSSPESECYEVTIRFANMTLDQMLEAFGIFGKNLKAHLEDSIGEEE